MDDDVPSCDNCTLFIGKFYVNDVVCYLTLQIAKNKCSFLQMCLQRKRVRISIINHPLPLFVTLITIFILSTAIFIIVSSKEETTEL